MSLAQSLSKEMSPQANAALARYLAELVRRYPPAAAHYRVEPWQGHAHTSLVSILPPEGEDMWLELNEAMAAVTTELVVETDHLFVLTTLE